MRAVSVNIMPEVSTSTGAMGRILGATPLAGFGCLDQTGHVLGLVLLRMGYPAERAAYFAWDRFELYMSMMQKWFLNVRGLDILPAKTSFTRLSLTRINW